MSKSNVTVNYGLFSNMDADEHIPFIEIKFDDRAMVFKCDYMFNVEADGERFLEQLEGLLRAKPNASNIFPGGKRVP